MFQRRGDFIGEFVAIDGTATATGAGRVAALNHERGDDAVEDEVIVVAALGEGREVCAGFGSVLVVEFNGDGALSLS